MFKAQIKIKTPPKSLIDLTNKINKIISSCDFKEGICNIFIQHTSCSLIISENYDNDVLKDLETWQAVYLWEHKAYSYERSVILTLA